MENCLHEHPSRQKPQRWRSRSDWLAVTVVVQLVFLLVATSAPAALAGPSPVVVATEGTGSRLACVSATLSLDFWNDGDDFAYFPFLDIGASVG